MNQRKNGLQRETIFVINKTDKRKAKKALELARVQTSEKLQLGFKYERSADGKTMILRKPEKPN